MIQFTLLQKFIGNIGTLKIELPILRFSQGKPQVAIIATQHGGETSGLFVIDRLINELWSIGGSLVILPVANPLGLIFRTREEPVEKADLNRAYPGALEKNFAQRLAIAILEAASGADAVLDLHSFTGRDTGILGVCHKGTNLSDKTAKLLQFLQPDAVWEIDTRQDEDKEFVGDLASSLTSSAIPVVGLEIPRQQNITNEQLERVVMGIKNLLAGLGVIKSALLPKAQQGIPVFSATQLHALDSGIFRPSVKVFKQVQAGEELGRFRSFSDFQSHSIKTKIAGIILTIHYPDAIRTGEKFASIGTKVREL